VKLLLLLVAAFGAGFVFAGFVEVDSEIDQLYLDR
jgi:hypothetical protein